MTMMITQDMDYQGDDYPVKRLMAEMKEFHQHSPFRTGIDWARQLYWATMTDEQCLMFCLKHPEYTNRFRKV